MSRVYSCDSLRRAIGCFSLVLVLSAGASCAKNPEDLLASGKQYLAEHKYSEAVIQLKSAINAKPELVDAHYQLALAYIYLGQPIDAAGEFRKVAVMDPNNLDAQLKSGNLLLFERKFSEAREKAQFILNREPANINALILLGNSHVGIVHVNDSLQELRQAFEVEPKLAPAFMDLSATANFQAKPGPAEEAYRKAISIDPQSIAARLALANLYLQTKQVDEAKRELMDLLSKNPASRDANQALAFFYVQTGQIPLAEEIYVKLADFNQQDLKQRVILAEFYSGSGKVDKGIEVLQKILEQDPEFLVAKRRLADLYLGQKEYEKATLIADEALKLNTNDVEARLIKGRSLLGQRRNAEALVELQKVAASKPAFAAGRYYFGLAQFESRNFDKAESEFLAAISNDGNFVQAYIPLAEIKLNLGQSDQAIKYARQALVNPDLIQAHLILSRAYMAAQDFVSASREVNAFLQQNPAHAAGPHHLGLLNVAQGNMVEAEKQFEAALRANPEYGDSLAALCDMFIRQKRPDKAVARASAAIAQFPRNPEYHRIQSYAYLAQNNPGKAQESFEKAVSLNPSDAGRRMELAEFYSTAGSADKAVALLQDIAKESGGTAAKRRLAEVYLAKKDYPAVLQLTDEILKSNAGDLETLIMKGRTLLAQGKTADGTVQLQAAVKNDPNSALARYYLGHAYLIANNRQAAETEWNDSIKSSPAFLAPQTALAQLKLESGDRDAAARFARQALAANANQPEAQLLLALATGDTGDFKKASALLEEYLLKNPTDAAQQQRLGVAFLGQGDLGRAETEFESALRSNPSSKDSVVGLVRVYLQRNQTDQAVARLNEQMTQNPQQGLWQLLAELHIRQKNMVRAEETYRRAVTLDPMDVNAKLALADFYLSTRKPANAMSVYEDLVKNNKDQTTSEARVLKARILMANARSAEAVTELQTAVTAYPGSAMIRYYLGSAYRQDNKPELAELAFNESINIDGRLSYAHLGLAQLKLLSGDPDRAIRSAEAALKLDARLADAVLVLGNAQMARGNVKEAVPVFERLVQLVPGNPVALERLGSAYAAQGNLPKAEAQFLESLRLSPDSIDSLTGLVRIYLVQRKPEAALARIQQHITRSENSSKLHEILGEVYMTQKNYTKAEEAYRKAISTDRGNFAAYGLLGQLFLIQKSSEKAVHEFENVLKINSKSVQAHIVLGVIHESQSNAEKSKFHYREALKLDPESPVAANNLAWLLAESGQDLQEASNLARKASAKLPNVPNVMDTMGWVYYKTGAYSSAVEVLKDCVEKAPRNPTFHYHLGMSYFKLGDRVKAKTYLDLAVKLDADFPGADDALRTLASLQ